MSYEGSTNARLIENRDVEKLKDANGSYPLWKFQMKIAFRAVRILGVVDRSLPGPHLKEDLFNAKDVQNWKRSDATAQRVITNIMDKIILVHLMNCQSAKEMWTIIKELYEHDTEEQRCILLEEFFNYLLIQRYRYNDPH